MNDLMFEQAYVDVNEWRDQPVRHQYIHGGFSGTDTRLSFYFPPPELYQGRFFHYITPVPISENLSQGATGEEDKIGFALASGAGLVETNGGGNQGAAMYGSGVDPLIGAYRANAASARHARLVAQQLYGPHRVYGYAFGGSGGAYRTLGGIENTEGVWDGAVPYVFGSPVAIPNVFCVRMHAMRILKDKFPQIVDSLEPGGSGDMYSGLNAEEQEALREVTRMGFPPKSWFAYQSMGVHAFSALYPGIVMADPTYFTVDFWSTPGYLGANPPASLLKARIQQPAQIKRAIAEEEAVRLGLIQPLPAHDRGTADAAWQSLGQPQGSMPVAFQLADPLPAVDFLGGDLIVLTGKAAGSSLLLTAVRGATLILGPCDPRLLAQIQPGDQVQVDNSNFLAAQTYHRHQVPGKEYPVWDQFRHPDGSPIYPQRQMLLGPLFTQNASGALPCGKYKGKLILLESLWDREAFPWQADWYRARVAENLGDKIDQQFRLWFTDRAIHADIEQQSDSTRVVSYLGVLQQALRDLSAWVEQGIEPPASTAYQVLDGQVILPETAAERKGIQPVVSLKANGSEKTVVKPGEPVEFEGWITVPPQAGQVSSAAFDFDGTGQYAHAAPLETLTADGSVVKVRMTHTFDKPGTYFPALRASSHRGGGLDECFAQIKNLARVRVVVE
jgi:hypothetical protein